MHQLIQVSLKTTTIMERNIIRIQFGSTDVRYTTIESKDEKFGICYMPKSAEDYIKAQSCDGKIYTAVGAVNDCYVYLDGNTTTYYIKIAESGSVVEPVKWQELRISTVKKPHEFDIVRFIKK